MARGVPHGVAIRDEFAVHLLNETGIDEARQIAKAFSDLLDYLDAAIPAGREKSIVITKLQEASFFAKRALALSPVYQPEGA